MAQAALGLGTVQFGMEYSIDPSENRPTQDDIQAILSEAKQAKIGLLDTAGAYGNAERLLGELAAGADFQIVTKVPPIRAPKISKEHAALWRAKFENSLCELRQDSIYGLLAHHAPDLLAQGGERLFDEMLALKAQGAVRKIGVSIYNAEDLALIADRYAIDLVQAPMNVLDQRLLRDGSLAKLASNGIEIHVRSIFLKGLLLLPPGRLPAYFDPLKPVLAKFHDVAESHGVSPMQLALAFALTREDVGTVLVGVTSRAQLAEIITSASSLPNLNDIDFAPFSIDDPAFLNPGRWPAFQA